MGPAHFVQHVVALFKNEKETRRESAPRARAAGGACGSGAQPGSAAASSAGGGAGRERLWWLAYLDV